jgi:perosamine synthetase
LYQDVAHFIRELFRTKDFIPLHEPRFLGNEKRYVLDAIDSTFLSSVGAYVDRFEAMMREATGAAHAVATVNGTSALHVALRLIGVQAGDEVLTQALTFVATANAISYCGATPVFLDVDRSTLGLSPAAVERFFVEETDPRPEGGRLHKRTGGNIAACVPMHTFGHPCEIEAIVEICGRFGVPVVEDAAESLGSSYRGKATGTFGRCGIFSFNGNKTVTCGGGGAMTSNDEAVARRGKHLTTTAKVAHPYAYFHDELGYNYRLPNLNAAVACAQLEQLESFVSRKRQLAERYGEYFDAMGIAFVREPPGARSNYWLNAIVLPDEETRDDFLRVTNEAGVMTRPAWTLLNRLPMFADCYTDGLENSGWLAERLVNIPSSVIAPVA